MNDDNTLLPDPVQVFHNIKSNAVFGGGVTLGLGFGTGANAGLTDTDLTNGNSGGGAGSGGVEECG